MFHEDRISVSMIAPRSNKVTRTMNVVEIQSGPCDQLCEDIIQAKL